MEKPSRKLKKTFLILGVTGAVYASFKYLLPLVIPFLIAYIFALALRPSAVWLEKKCRLPFKKKEIHLPLAAIGGIQILILMVLFGTLLYYGGRKLFMEANLFFDNLPQMINSLDHWLTGCCFFTENLLRLLRPDMKYSQVEAHVLDLALILHMEHGGGNNSTFTTHVVTSSGTDTYSVISAALASLKGPKHGGANIKVVEMMQDLRSEVKDVTDRDEVESYLKKLLHKEAFDRKGLIYGMGHAVYSKSDPRAEIFKRFVRQLSEEKGRMEEFALYSMIEELGPKVITEERRIYKGVSANVDFYSGFVYSMLDIPEEMFTPIFAIARIVGWSAHRIEELINMDKIIRPAYTSIMKEENYKPLCDR